MRIYQQLLIGLAVLPTGKMPNAWR